MQDDLAGLIERLNYCHQYGLLEATVNGRVASYGEAATALETLTRERDEARAEAERLKDERKGIINNIPMSYLQGHDANGATGPTPALNLVAAMREYAEDRWAIIEKQQELRTQLTATQARLAEAVGLLADALTGARDWQRRRFSFLAQQEGQSNG